MAAVEIGVEQRIEGLDGAVAPEGRDEEKEVAGPGGEVGMGVGGDELAEEGLPGDDARVSTEAVEDPLHGGEHAGAGEHGEEEVVARVGVGEGVRSGEKEGESGAGVCFPGEERG